MLTQGGIPANGLLVVRRLPCCALKMIPPDAQREMSTRAGATVVEVKGSQAIYVSQPGAVARLIEVAARGAKATAK